MKIILRQFLTDWFPPKLRLLLNRNRNVIWSGNYASWSEAQRDSAGYDSRIILDKVRTALIKVRNGEAVYERDSVLFNKIEYAWPLLAGILWVAGKNHNSLNVMDFGGSLGSSYFQNKNFLSHLTELRWCIVEQKEFAECGKKYFEEDCLHFYESAEECFRNENINVALLSSVLPYVEKPYELFEKIWISGVKHVIIDRTPFLLSGNRDRLTVQKVPPAIYDASYPAWFFNKKNFLDFIDTRYKIIAESDCPDQANIHCEFKGFILERR